jgi:outer membrane protein TolC
MRLVRARQQSYEISSRSVELAERRVESAKLSQQAGRASTRDFLEAQEDLLEAQNDATRALIDYALSRLELYRDMEILVVDEDGVRPDFSLILENETVQS